MDKNDSALEDLLNRRTFSLLAISLGVLTTVLSIGCSPRYVRGTEIKYTVDKQDVANLVERYRIALERRDIDTLRTLAHQNYFENGSTTTEPADDYDYNGLQKVLADLQNKVKAVKYEIEIKDIQFIGNLARVDYTYRSQYLLVNGERDRWSSHADKNRITFQRVPKGKKVQLADGTQVRWRILAGM